MARLLRLAIRQLLNSLTIGLLVQNEFISVNKTESIAFNIKLRLEYSFIIRCIVEQKDFSIFIYGQHLKFSSTPLQIEGCGHLPVPLGSGFCPHPSPSSGEKL